MVKLYTLCAPCISYLYIYNVRFDLPAWLNILVLITALMLAERRPGGFEFFVGECKMLYYNVRVYTYILYIYYLIYIEGI